MVQDTARVNAEAREALRDLVTSRGWEILSARVMELEGPEAVAASLQALAQQTTDMQALGTLTASRLTASNMAKFILQLPRIMLADLGDRS